MYDVASTCCDEGQNLSLPPRSYSWGVQTITCGEFVGESAGFAMANYNTYPTYATNPVACKANLVALVNGSSSSSGAEEFSVGG